MEMVALVILGIATVAMIQQQKRAMRHLVRARNDDESSPPRRRG